ncbi:unnamed protein product [Coffea canephora]|uniref:NAD-dependent epimerase/dehydratase domain-containing protein n=1 Tax=Coffea canephora TaxID=49390 RepID=A0A068V233_COFCA|nr:unnamed protein product [Coffea canephora]
MQKTVCVTGASGFIASWLVKFLLHRGYIVKASVRDLNDPKKVAHLLALDGASERLQLFKANLLEEGSFDASIDGCDGVFHIASPFHDPRNDPQAELIDPAVKGTLNVLKSYFCKETKSWYILAKTLAEDEAWKFVKENDIDMVAINPAMVIGPLLQPTLNTSGAVILNLINGAETFPNSTFPWVDVKDVANAHILAFENPLASGRYCLVEQVAHYSKVMKILHELFPSLKLPVKCADDKPFVPEYQVSKEKAKSLGIEFTPFEQSIKETVESLKEKKLLVASVAL